MKVGLPKGLLYFQYGPMFKTFFEELGAELVISDDTNKKILDAGVRICTSEACLPMKVFLGHVVSIKDQCDYMVIPRIIKVNDGCYICPHLCSLPDTVKHLVPSLPAYTDAPLFFNDAKALYRWATEAAKPITTASSLIEKAFYRGLIAMVENKPAIHQKHYPHKVLLIGHTYHLYDAFANMHILQKLNDLGIGIITSDATRSQVLNKNMGNLPRPPFWHYYLQSYGSVKHLYENHQISGVIMLAAFGCATDAMIFEHIREDFTTCPMMMVKLDEHSGDAGLDTRLEAFVHMLERRENLALHSPSLR